MDEINEINFNNKGLKRYIVIQFAKMGFNNSIENINTLIKTYPEYNYILKIIIKYYMMEK